VAVNSANLPRIGEHGAAITMDWRLAAFTIAASLGTGILFGLAPAIGLVRSDFASRLREGGSRSGVAQVKDGVVKRLAQVTSLAWAIRVRGESFSLQRAIKQELLTNSDGQPVTKILSMNELVYESTARNRFNMLLMGVFAVSAVILAAIGIYGLMAYTTEHRTHEIGVMFALGAEPLRIVRPLAAQAMKFASLGIAIGVLAGLALVRFMASLLFGVTSRDPLVFIGVPLVVAGVSLISVLGPAIRAGRIDAAEALRRE
jgi:ABC-type antimicrobial peptide transport system permease subunit